MTWPIEMERGVGMWFVFRFGCAALIWIAAESGQAASNERPPNIVVFLADDLGAGDLGCFGSRFYETPHLDRLAAEGMRFTAAYSACPVCSPSRASMITGRYPQRSGVTDYINARGRNRPEQWTRNTRLLPAPYSDRLALEERTIAEALHEAGYATFFAGKWHLGGDGFLPTDQGFDRSVNGLEQRTHRDSESKGQRKPKIPEPGGKRSIPLAEQTCQFIAANADRPFFAYLSFYAVHIPLEASPELIRKYETKAAERVPATRSWGRERNSKVRLVQNHPTYAAMIETMDRAVGMVLDRLEELGLAENTLVIFTSDNGGLATAEGSPTANVPLRAGKGWLYEGGIRVPTIIRWPSVTRPGRVSASPIISNDYFPTILAAATRRKAASSDLDGIDLAPILRGGQVEARALYWHYPHYGNQGGAPGSAVREGRWKLIEWHEGAVELYDLKGDPSETENLAKRHPERAARLQAALSAWRRDIGAKMPMPNPRFTP